MHFLLYSSPVFTALRRWWLCLTPLSILRAGVVDELKVGHHQKFSASARIHGGGGVCSVGLFIVDLWNGNTCKTFEILGAFSCRFFKNMFSSCLYTERISTFRYSLVYILRLKSYWQCKSWSMIRFLVSVFLFN